MSFAHYLKEIAHHSEVTSELSERDAHQLFGAMLDGGVPELELGALLMTLRVKSESLVELLGFYGALDERLFKLNPPDTQARPVVLPSYGGAREQPNLLPLFALLLRRFGVPVLVHGSLNGDGRIASVYIFRELGILPCANLKQTQDALDRDGIAFAPTAILASGLSDLLSLRGRLGVRSSAHILAKLIDPFGSGLRVVGAVHQTQYDRLKEFLLSTGARALLLCGTEGEPFANPSRRPRLEYFNDAFAEILFEAEAGPLKNTALTPQTIDASTTAVWIKRALAGEVPIPLPIINQLASCLYASGYSQDLNQAKAMVAVEVGNHVAA